MADGYIEIKTYINQIEAEIAKGMLIENGIHAVISKDDCGGMLPNLQLTEGVHLLVHRKDFETAKTILFEPSVPNRISGEQSSAEWTCQTCGETLEPQFTDCWNCGAPRQDSA